MRRIVDAAEARAKPYLVWNAFVDLIATEDFLDLTPVQRLAHLVFQYESEVQNGGHYQFFVNTSGSRAPETVDALVALQLHAQAEVLRNALALWRSQPRTPPLTADHFIHDAELDEFGDLDAAFHRCPMSIVDRLSTFLSERQADFVELANDAH